MGNGIVQIRAYDPDDRESVIQLVAAFRVDLSALCGQKQMPDVASAAGELQEYLDNEYPVFVAIPETGSAPIGYLVCKVEEGTIWAESLFVSAEFRRCGVAARLYDEAEKLAHALGQETLYNWVHPNNDAIIAFLKTRGYDVLNLIEIRRRYDGDKEKGTLRVGNHDFAYGLASAEEEIT